MREKQQLHQNKFFSDILNTYSGIGKEVGAIKDDRVNIQVFQYDREQEPESAAVYYPYVLTTWEVQYQTLFRKRVENVCVMTNRIKGGSTLAHDLPPLSNMAVSVSETMEAKLSTEEAVEDAREMVRRYYVHIARSWSVPVIRQRGEQSVYVPYLIVSKPGRIHQREHVYLYEPLSASYEKIKVFPEIHKFYREKVI